MKIYCFLFRSPHVATRGAEWLSLTREAKAPLNKAVILRFLLSDCKDRYLFLHNQHFSAQNILFFYVATPFYPSATPPRTDEVKNCTSRSACSATRPIVVAARRPSQNRCRGRKIPRRGRKLPRRGRKFPRLQVFTPRYPLFTARRPAKNRCYVKKFTNDVIFFTYDVKFFT